MAVLACSGDRGVSRDVLYGYFWPESSADAARRSLDQLIYALRRSLGETLFAGTNPLLLNSAAITSDWSDFADAVSTGRVSAAVALYRGPFLDGFFVSDAPEFERWVESQRGQLAESYKTALVTLAEQADVVSDHATAVRWLRMLVAADPLSGRATARLMRALGRAGDLGAALQEALRHEIAVRESLGSAPDPSVTALAREMRAGAAAEQANPATPAVSSLPSTTARPPLSGVGDPVVSPSHAGPHTASVPLPAAAVERPKSLGRRWLLLGGMSLAVGVSLLAAFVLGSASGDRSSSVERAPAGTASRDGALPTIAVLPFTADSGDAESERFGDAMTDELITQLAKTGVLRVTARTSAFLFKGHHTDVRRIADSLGVDNVLEATVQRVGSVIRLRVRLVNAIEGATRWSESYDRDVQDVFAVQDDIARAVVAALKAELAPGLEPRLARVPRTNLAAYEQYLRGRHQWYVRGDSTLRVAIAYFNRAIALDSSYAAAFAGVAHAYALLGTGNYGDYDARADYKNALAAVSRAIAIDSNLAEAHSALGFIKTVFELDWAGAEAALARASELDPTYSVAHLQRATLFAWLSRGDEAIASARRSQATDPLSASASTELARTLLFARRYDDALAELARAHAMDSTFQRHYLIRGEVYAMKDMKQEAISDLRRVAMAPGRPPRANSLLAHTLAAAGRRDEALGILNELMARWRDTRIGAFEIAVVYAGLRDYDRTFLWLDRSYDDRSIRPYIMGPTFDEVRADPRFQLLMRKLRLPASVGLSRDSSGSSRAPAGGIPRG